MQITIEVAVLGIGAISFLMGYAELKIKTNRNEKDIAKIEKTITTEMLEIRTKLSTMSESLARLEGFLSKKE